jgi:hypothetical protein
MMDGVLLTIGAYRAEIITLYLLCSSSLILGITGKSLQDCRAWVSGWVLASMTTFILCRLPVIGLNSALNPDESQLIANASKFMTDMSTWRSVDTTSSGPINSFVLMWANALGGSGSFVTARLTLVAFLCAAWVMLFAATAGKPLLLRIVVGTLTMLCFSGASADLHYTSEAVSVALLALGLMVAARHINAAVGWRSLAIGAFALGLVPFAKLQAAPVAAVIGIWQFGYAAARGSGTQRIKNLAALGAGACLPAVALLVPLALTEGLQDFWNSYIVWAQLYVVPSLSFAQLVETVGSSSTYGFSGPIVELFFIGCLSVCACGVIGWICGLNRFHPRELQTLLLAAAVVLVSIFVVIRPGRMFPHYLYLLVIPSAFFAACSWGTRAARWRPFVAHGRLMRACQTAAVALCAASFLGAVLSFSEVMIIHPPLEVRAADRLFSAGNLLRDGDAARPRLLIWGWMPQWYVYSDAIPATRDIHTYNQMMPSILRSYFRSRLLQEVNTSPPEYIIDAAASGSFWYTNPSEDGLATFPALQQIVDTQYTRLSSNVETCPRVFISQNMTRALQERFMNLKNIRASAHLVSDGKAFSPEHINDNLFFETCVDRWLLPDGQKGSISFDLERPQPVGSILLLNTSNGAYSDRSTKNVRLTLSRQEKAVFSRDAAVRPWPFWTTLDVPDDLGDVEVVTIDVLDFVGRGGGLNEVRVRRR